MHVAANATGQARAQEPIFMIWRYEWYQRLLIPT